MTQDEFLRRLVQPPTQQASGITLEKLIRAKKLMEANEAPARREELPDSERIKLAKNVTPAP